MMRIKLFFHTAAATVAALAVRGSLKGLVVRSACGCLASDVAASSYNPELLKEHMFILSH